MLHNEIRDKATECLRSEHIPFVIAKVGTYSDFEACTTSVEVYASIGSGQSVVGSGLSVSEACDDLVNSLKAAL